MADTMIERGLGQIQVRASDVVGVIDKVLERMEGDFTRMGMGVSALAINDVRVSLDTMMLDVVMDRHLREPLPATLVRDVKGVPA